MSNTRTAQVIEFPIRQLPSAVATSTPAEGAPRNCVTRMPTVGGNSVVLIGWDGGSNPWCRLEFSLKLGEEEIDLWHRYLANKSREMPDLLAPSTLPPLRRR